MGPGPAVKSRILRKEGELEEQEAVSPQPGRHSPVLSFCEGNQPSQAVLKVQSGSKGMLYRKTRKHDRFKFLCRIT